MENKRKHMIVCPQLRNFFTKQLIGTLESELDGKFTCFLNDSAIKVSASRDDIFEDLCSLKIFACDQKQRLFAYNQFIQVH